VAWVAVVMALQAMVAHKQDLQILAAAVEVEEQLATKVVQA
jgi:hypothetical protein